MACSLLQTSTSMLLLRAVQSAAARGFVYQPVTSLWTMSFVCHFPCQRQYVLASRQKLLSTVNRLYSYELRKVPLDAESLSALITEDVTVYTYSNKRLFWLLTVFGGMQLVFWTNIALFIKSDPTVEHSGKTDRKSLKNDRSWMSTFYANNQTEIAAACFAIGKHNRSYFQVL